MIISIKNKELFKEVQEYVWKCTNKDCEARWITDGCAWCYVEYLKDINLNKYIKRLVIKKGRVNLC